MLDRDYLAAGWLDYGYASTVHTAQGVTCDHVLVVGPAGLYREALYVAMSRARLSAWIYGTTTEALDLVDRHATGIPLPGERVPDPEHDLIERIHVSGVKQLVSSRDAEAARIGDLATEVPVADAARSGAAGATRRADRRVGGPHQPGRPSGRPRPGSDVPLTRRGRTPGAGAGSRQRRSRHRSRRHRRHVRGLVRQRSGTVGHPDDGLERAGRHRSARAHRPLRGSRCDTRADHPRRRSGRTRLGLEHSLPAVSSLATPTASSTRRSGRVRPCCPPVTCRPIGLAHALARPTADRRTGSGRVGRRRRPDRT